MQSLFESIDQEVFFYCLWTMVIFWIAWWLLFRRINRNRAAQWKKAQWKEAEIKNLAAMNRKPLKINKIKIKQYACRRR